MAKTLGACMHKGLVLLEDTFFSFTSLLSPERAIWSDYKLCDSDSKVGCMILSSVEVLKTVDGG